MSFRLQILRGNDRRDPSVRESPSVLLCPLDVQWDRLSPSVLSLQQDLWDRSSPCSRAPYLAVPCPQ